MGLRVREFTLSDGSIMTSKILAKKLNCAVATAYNRLTTTTNVDKVFAPISATSRGAVYTLDDGTVWTVDEVAEKMKIKRSTAGSRLSQSTDPKKVFAEPRSATIRTAKDNHAKRRIKERMYYDPLGHWKLINKAL